MRKYLLLVIFLALLCIGAGRMYDYGALDLYGEDNLKFVDQVESGAAVCTQQEEYGTTEDAYHSAFTIAGRTMVAYQFDTGGVGYTLTQLRWRAYYPAGGDGTPEGTVTPYLCGDNSDAPDCSNTTCSGGGDSCTAGTTKAISTFPTSSVGDVDWIFPSVSLSASTTYWLVLHSSNVGDDEAVRAYNDSVGESNDVEIDSDGASWSEVLADRQQHMYGYYGSCP